MLFVLKLNPQMMNTEPFIFQLKWGACSVRSWASPAIFRAALMFDFLLLPRILGLGFTHIAVLHFLYWKKPKPNPFQWTRSPVVFQWPIFTFSLPTCALWAGLCLTSLGCLQAVMCDLHRREGSHNYMKPKWLHLQNSELGLRGYFAAKTLISQFSTRADIALCYLCFIAPFKREN